MDSNDNPSDELKYFIGKNERGYSRVVKSYSWYVSILVWFNLIFKIVSFLGSAAILFFTTKALLDVVHRTLSPSLTSVIARFLKGEDAMSADRLEALLAALGAFVTAIIVIPLTITKYLFNQQELEQFTSHFRAIQQHNEKLLHVEGDEDGEAPSKKPSPETKEKPKDRESTGQ